MRTKTLNIITISNLQNSNIGTIRGTSFSSYVIYKQSQNLHLNLTSFPPNFEIQNKL
ncbi:MAG: hypothetical protein ACOVNU_12765 [Candidatus Kapaibacteriota bacterium]